jgi:hypothetical protein
MTDDTLQVKIKWQESEKKLKPVISFTQLIELVFKLLTYLG